MATPAQAQAIRDIAWMYINGKTIGEILAMLASRGIELKGKNDNG